MDLTYFLFSDKNDSILPPFLTYLLHHIAHSLPFIHLRSHQYTNSLYHSLSLTHNHSAPSFSLHSVSSFHFAWYNKQQQQQTYSCLASQKCLFQNFSPSLSLYYFSDQLSFILLFMKTRCSHFSLSLRYTTTQHIVILSLSISLSHTIVLYLSPTSSLFHIHTLFLSLSQYQYSLKQCFVSFLLLHFLRLLNYPVMHWQAFSCTNATYFLFFFAIQLHIFTLSCRYKMYLKTL